MLPSGGGGQNGSLHEDDAEPTSSSTSGRVSAGLLGSAAMEGMDDIYAMDGMDVELGSSITELGEERMSISYHTVQSSHDDVMLLPEQNEENRAKAYDSSRHSDADMRDDSPGSSEARLDHSSVPKPTARVSSSTASGTGSNAIVGAEAARGGFEGDFDEPFWEKVAVKVKLEGQPQKAALQETRVDRIVEQHGSVDKALLWVLKECPMQGETIRILSGMLPRGVDLKDGEALQETGETALHSAAERNFYHVVHGLLIYDSDAPVGRQDASGKLPVELAMKGGFDKLAALLVRSMSKSSVRALFEAGESGTPKHSFQDLVKKGNMSETCQEIMNACIEPTGEPDELRFHFNILEADRHGNTPSDRSFSFESSTAYHRAVESNDKAVRQHALIRMLTYDKWTSYGEHLALLKLALYLAFLFVISFSLISAAKQANPASYNSHEDNARAFFEVLSILFVIHQIVEGVAQFRRIYFDYFKSGWNIIRVLSWLLFLVIIPLRFSEVSGQWHVASIVFALVWIRLLELMSVTRFVDIYMQMLARILVKDVSRFLVVFLSILIAYAGSLVLALRGEKWTGSETPEENRTVPGETTELGITRLTNSFGATLLTGFRSMVQQENLLDYVDSSGTEASYSWLAIIINILFLFFLLVVLLNILIAQLSDTYAEVQGDAQHELEQNWADAIKVQEQRGGSMMTRFRFKSFKSFSDILEPGDLIIAWESSVAPTTTTATSSGGGGGGGGSGGPSAEEKADTERRQVKMGTQIERASAKIESLSFQVKMIVDMLRNMEEETQPRLQKTITHFQEEVLTDCMQNIVEKSTDLMSSQVKKLEENTAVQMDTLGNTLSPEHVRTIVTDTVQASLRPLYTILQQHQERLVDMATRSEVEEFLRQQPVVPLPKRRTLLDQLLGVPPATAAQRASADLHSASSDLHVVETTQSASVVDSPTEATDGQLTHAVPTPAVTMTTATDGDVISPPAKHGAEADRSGTAGTTQDSEDSASTTRSSSILDRLYAAVGTTELLGTTGTRTAARDREGRPAGSHDTPHSQTTLLSAGDMPTAGSSRRGPSPATSETSWVLFNDDLQEYRVMNPANTDGENATVGTQQQYSAPTVAADAATQHDGQFAATAANAEDDERERHHLSAESRAMPYTAVGTAGPVITPASDVTVPLPHADMAASPLMTSQQSHDPDSTDETDSRSATPVARHALPAEDAMATHGTTGLGSVSQRQQQ